MAERYLTMALRILVLGIGVIWSAFPIFMVVSSSFKTHLDIFSYPPKIFDFAPTLDNYRALFREWPEFVDGLWNSLIVTVGATLLTAAVSLVAGYAYSRYQSRWLTMSAFSMIVMRMLPPLVVTIPLFPVVNWLRLNDTHTLLILLYAAFFVSLSTWILKTFIDQIPRELEEAAEVEGATLVQRLVQIILPAVGAWHGGGLRLRGGVCVERVHVRADLHLQQREDGTPGGPCRDHWRARGGPVGRSVRRRDRAAGTDPRLRPPRPEVHRHRPDGRRGEGITQCLISRSKRFRKSTGAFRR